ncbi:hypothetical protein O159_18510 [Leifsonia xyli subsp. cynodontis DSM 46306]|uniref:Regulatory protein RecX n=1 Tax=Leifsonia xyli subsp. cynodontis DSM 46306 TaxID=1389489 RepID=U3P8S6_LEIXC|nr:RecX family transcriptional regulator [Leifsonia xyli]AGW41874.1 hypothetical protein O159_18510 [Leifsonia xyli subsp. cynodontis DSM 46306]
MTRSVGQGGNVAVPRTVRPVAELPRAQGVSTQAVPAQGGALRNDTGAEEPPVAAPAREDVSGEQDERLGRAVTGLTIRQLARRGMSRWELEQLLTTREIASEVYGPELDRLEAMGVIDDASLAATLAFAQHSRKGRGKSAIEQDLKRRHIDPELIELALGDIADEDELMCCSGTLVEV